MNARIAVDRLVDWTAADHAELRELASIANSPDMSPEWPGRALQWASAEWCVRIRDGDRRLVSSAGMVLRDGTRDGEPVRIGGIGGVQTHPEARRRGYAALAVARATEFFRAQGSVAFGLLVCEPDLIPYYTARGWREFHGRLLVRDRDAAAEFTLSRVLTYGVRSPAPASGTIDLCGPPW
jgi:aminoglycoside 2'-N-acetyltransferase I